MPENPSPRVTATMAGAVAVVTMDDSSRRNALHPQMREELLDALNRLALEPTVRALVIIGASDVFSAGGDLGTMPPNSFDEARERMGRVGALISTLYHLDKPVVAAVSGPAAGVAVGLVCACDVIVIGGSTRFLFPFARLGLIPDGGLPYLLSQRIGSGAARRALLTGEQISAGDALRLGLADEVVEDTEVLDRAIERAAALSNLAPASIRLIKEGMRTAAGSLNGALAFEQKHQPHLYKTADFLEGKAAFYEQRAPRFHQLDATKS